MMREPNVWKLIIEAAIEADKSSEEVASYFMREAFAYLRVLEVPSEEISDALKRYAHRAPPVSPVTGRAVRGKRGSQYEAAMRWLAHARGL